MSTYYATFHDLRNARLMLDELIRDGVRPEDLSLIASLEGDGQESTGIMSEYAKSVGDATVFVGREDDPIPLASNETGSFFGYTTLEEGEIGRIDTSDEKTDVESIDQADESQEMADKMTYPLHNVSQGEHMSDDMNLSLLTGFPTAVTQEDALWDGQTDQDQFDETLETIVIPGLGLVIGGGALATAVLEEYNPEGPPALEALMDHLVDEGMSRESAEVYRDAYEHGDALLAVAINPGAINENKVELLAERYRATEANLFDAPRY